MKLAVGLLVATVYSCALASGSGHRTLTFEERVNAQAAIERVYYAHQIGATQAFEAAVPRAVLESKVRKYLEQTVALDVYWKTAVSDEMLQAELERMAHGTKMPERLLELYAALGNDPFVIKECLARATLVDRLIHNFYAFDPTLHIEPRRRAEELRRQLSTGELSPLTGHPNRSVAELVMSETTGEKSKSLRRQLSPDEFHTQRSRLPDVMGQVSALEEESDAFVLRVGLSETAGDVRVANYVVAKTTWDAWWEEAKTAVQAAPVVTVASDRAPLPLPAKALRVGADSERPQGIRLPSPGLSCLSIGSASPNAVTMVCGGGNDSTQQVDVVIGGEPTLMLSGLTFDVMYDGSSLELVSVDVSAASQLFPGALISVVPSPEPNSVPGYKDVVVAIQMTGSVLVPVDVGQHLVLSLSFSRVPGATFNSAPVAFNPERILAATPATAGTTFASSLVLSYVGDACPGDDTWTPGSMTDAPSARAGHTTVWTGSLMVVWGGYYVNTGGRYDPATDSWTPTSTTGAPSARAEHTAVWTGSLMVVWGGYDVGTYLDTGGRYDPTTDSWTPMSTTSAPSARVFHTVVWTGRLMVVWGGLSSDAYTDVNTGGRYDPAADTWTPTSTAGAPSPRNGHTAVWTGSLMVVWGGWGEEAAVNTGGRYDPAADSWTLTSTTGVPSALGYHTAVWTGSLMVVWGGNDSTGGRYDPAADTWIPTSTMGAPSARSYHTAVWTGSRMFVWGGYDASGRVNTGGRYDPVADSWTPTSTTGAPSGRDEHAAVWTGSLMVVWGGWGEEAAVNTGGRYDPAADSWTPTYTTGAPSARTHHTAVWTGSLMVVWGGRDFSAYLDTGGRYDPATDSWTPTSTAGAPSARGYHTTVWTGSRMVAWGGYFYDGYDGTDHFLNTGGRYDPVADSWTPTSMTGAPSARSVPTTVWTGSRMVLWGGYFYDGSDHYLNTGGRYDPAADSWTPTSTAGAPSTRSSHKAVWTGSRMVVWGGYFYDGLDHELNTGGRYDPAADSWTRTSTTGAPSGRYGHTLVWTGSLMVVWGGWEGSEANTGGRYDPATDSWTPTSTTGAPSARSYHTAVWTGSLMTIWGSNFYDGSNYYYLNTGGQYDPATDSWTPTSTTGAPSARAGHTAVWTGSLMVIWGGYDGGAYLDTGATYDLSASIDNDGDGYSECQGDCDDANPAIHPSASEVCNGIDDDCDDVIDNGDGILCGDGNACTNDVCNGATGCSHVNNAAACNDSNVCTDDSCNPASGCFHTTNTAACIDGNACTKSDHCVAGACVGGPPLDCNDSNVCTNDSCNPASGCVHTNNTAACIDGSACTTNDACNGGACVGGTPLDCNDSNACTADSCIPASGCVNTDNSAACGDGNVCTADVCDPAIGCIVNHQTANMDAGLGFSADRVDGRDLVVLADAWNSCPTEQRYNADANLDPQDPCIVDLDFREFMKAFGHSCPVGTLQ